jgi:hypothetical protein
LIQASDFTPWNKINIRITPTFSKHYDHGVKICLLAQSAFYVVTVLIRLGLVVDNRELSESYVNANGYPS